MSRIDLPPCRNIYADVPVQLPEELFEHVLIREGVEIERIVSRGHVTAPGEWYDQAWDEWVLLLQGQAQLRFQNENKPIDMLPGDYVLIPAHVRHRVEWTATATDTMWLAIHFR